MNIAFEMRFFIFEKNSSFFQVHPSVEIREYRELEQPECCVIQREIVKSLIICRIWSAHGVDFGATTENITFCDTVAILDRFVSMKILWDVKG